MNTARTTSADVAKIILQNGSKLHYPHWGYNKLQHVERIEHVRQLLRTSVPVRNALGLCNTGTFKCWYERAYQYITNDEVIIAVLLEDRYRPNRKTGWPCIADCWLVEALPSSGLPNCIPHLEECRRHILGGVA